MPSRTVADLIADLTHADPRVRRDAGHALADVGPDALPALDALTVAVDDDDQQVRLAAVHALGVLDPREAEMALLWASQSDDLRVRQSAVALIEGTARERGPESTVFREPASGYGD